MFARLAIAAILVASSMWFAVSAQTPRAGDSSDAITALVTELRAIRADLAGASERSLRFQLLLARLQLQEQRIANLDRQRAEINQSLMDTHTMTTMFNSQFEQMERDCAEAKEDSERKACESQLATMKATAGSHQAREQQLRVQEGELMQAIGAEQGRWSEFSARLDELERALARR